MEKRKKKLILSSLLITLILFLVVIAFGGIYLWDKLGDSFEEIDRYEDGQNDDELDPKNVLKEPVNILLLGVDSNQTEVGRSDTIMLVRLEPETGAVKVVSLPRDTYTEIVGKGYSDKVNHSLNYGVSTSIATVENFFDLKIDYYAMIDFKGFTKAIDALGGIEINVEKPMHYVDNAGGVYIDLEPGLQTLDGEEALGYARFRNDKQGDLGRIERQQEVIMAVIDKSTDIRSLTKIFGVLDILGDHFKTDIPRADMVKIATTYMDISSEDIQSIKVNGESQRFGSQNLWYYVVDDEERQRLHNMLVE